MQKLSETITQGGFAFKRFINCWIYMILSIQLFLYVSACHECCIHFGKFVEIQFDQNGRILGAVRTYLPERSRVCQVFDPERNYHCFYMLYAAPPEMSPIHTDSGMWYAYPYHA